MKIPQSSPLFPVALHYFEGAFKKQDVPVGDHDLSRLSLTLIAPDCARVVRLPGSEGDGHEAIGPPESVTAAAALLFIERSGLIGPTTFALWKMCIKEANERELKAKDLTPPEAKTALKQIHGEMQDDCKSVKATPATRVGIGGVEVEIERLSMAGHAKRLTPAKR